MISKVLSFADEHHMLKRGEWIVAGVSGGADSVCLLLFLSNIQKERELSITVVHVEHGIRGKDSEEDARFVQTLCERHGMDFRLFHVDAGAYANTHGLSLEEAARKLRYELLHQVLEECGADKIAVAHNKNDCAETMLFHLARGCGLRGMSGIPCKHGAVVRPLLCLSRAEIEAYLLEQGQDYRVDATNRDTAYSRNKIRHQVLPFLEEINEQAVNHFFQAAGQLREAADLIEGLALEAKQRHVREHIIGKVCSKGLALEPIVIQRSLIHHLLAECAGRTKDISKIHVEQVRGLFKKQVGKELSLPYGIVAERTYDGIQLYRNSHCERNGVGRAQECRDEEYPVVPGVDLAIPGTSWVLKSRILSQEKVLGLQERVLGLEEEEIFDKIPKKKYTKYLNYDKIKGVMVLRRRKPGDYFVLDGQRGKECRQKLKDYFINEKVPRKERDQVWLLAEERHVLWAIGYRISEAAKISEQTKEVLEIQIMP